MFVQSHFFGTRVVPSVSEQSVPLTLVRVAERTDSGMCYVFKALEYNIQQALDYTDYQLNTLLAAGIQPSSIKLIKDLRIGSDKEIEAFNNRIDALAEKMFNL